MKESSATHSDGSVADGGSTLNDGSGSTTADASGGMQTDASGTSGSEDAGESLNCHEGESRCDGRRRMVCKDGGFVAEESCRVGCRSGSCTDVCDGVDEGSVRSLCTDDDALLRCENGRSTTTQCELGCRDERCLACTPNTTVCRSDLERAVCDEAGVETTEACDFACSTQGCSEGLLCPEMQECGGYPVGHWTVRNTCRTITEGALDTGAGFPMGCAVSVRFTEQKLVGELELQAHYNGTLSGTITENYAIGVTRECQFAVTREFCDEFSRMYWENFNRDNVCEPTSDALSCSCSSKGVVSMSGHELQGLFQAGSFCATAERLRLPWSGINTVVSLERKRSLTYLKPDQVRAEAFFGSAVAADRNVLVVGAQRESGDQGTVYAFERGAQGWRQQAQLTSPTAAPGDLFGSAVALSGDTLVVGSRNTDSRPVGAADRPLEDTGAAYVYRRIDASWVLEGTLLSPRPEATERFGWSVGISGERIVIGAPNNSRQVAQPPVDTETDTDAGAGTPAAGGTLEYSGSVYVFARSAGRWTLEQELKAAHADAADYFGLAVAIEGDTLVASAPGEDGAGGDERNNGAADSGAVYVFARSGSGWLQQAYLKADKDTLGPQDAFGRSIAMSGETIVVSAPAKELQHGTGDVLWAAGAAYVFVRTADGWKQQATLFEPQPAENHQFGGTDGHGVAIHGGAIAVAAPLSNTPGSGFNGVREGRPVSSSGAVHTFVRVGEEWRHDATLKASNAEALDFFGTSVAIVDAMIVVGAPQEDGADQDPLDNSANSAGAVYIFE